jgi:hypothetical protein
MAQMLCLTSTSILATAQLRGKHFAYILFLVRIMGLRGQSELVVWQFDGGTTKGSLRPEGVCRVLRLERKRKGARCCREWSSTFPRYETCLFSGKPTEKRTDTWLSRSRV